MLAVDDTALHQHRGHLLGVIELEGPAAQVEVSATLLQADGIPRADLGTLQATEIIPLVQPIATIGHTLPLARDPLHKCIHVVLQPAPIVPTVPDHTLLEQGPL